MTKKQQWLVALIGLVVGGPLLAIGAYVAIELWMDHSSKG